MINPDKNHEYLVKKIGSKLSKILAESFEEGKIEIEKKFLELTGVKTIEENACPLNLTIERDEDKGDYRLIRFTFESEREEIVPCYLLIPKLPQKQKYPIAITLQGHSTGFHNSIGEAKYEGDEKNYPRTCNYIPFAYQYFEMADLACIIEPRNILLLTGKKDTIFPIEGVRRAFQTIQNVYKCINATEKCKLIETENGHMWCDDLIWPSIKEECERLGGR